jgi:hypothetical protein
LFYRALAPKIGMLSPDLILGITQFHQNFQETKVSLPLLIGNPDRKYSYSVLTVLKPARDAVENIRPTLDKIERMALIMKPAESIDLGHVEHVIEMEEELFRGG